MIYQSVSRKYFVWLYKHTGTFKKSILLCVLLSILAVIFSLIFVQVTKIFIEAVEKGENFSFILLVVSLTTIKGLNIFCTEFKTYLREKQTSLMKNELSLKFFKKLFSGSVSYNERVHSGDSLRLFNINNPRIDLCLCATYRYLCLSLVN